MVNTKQNFPEDQETRHKRYQDAQQYAETWRQQLSEAYKYTFPLRNDFYSATEGESRFNDIFDGTAGVAVNEFVNNVQSLLMPPFKRWAELQLSEESSDTEKLDDDEKQSVNENLQSQTARIFQYINDSNLSNALNESCQDMAISTGVLLINEGDERLGECPLQFVSVPLSYIAVEEGANGSIDSFWQERNIPIRLITRQWPAAKLTKELERRLEADGGQKIQLIEGVIYYPNVSGDKKYFHYLQEYESKSDLFYEWRDYNPYIAFRYSKSPRETYGSGPILQVLPFIKVLNKIAEYELESAKFHVAPIIMAMSTVSLNPSTLRIEPGAVLGMDASMPIKDQIATLDVGGNPQFIQLTIEQLREIIQKTLFAAPMGDVADTPNRSATEMSLRYQEFSRKNTVAIGRLTQEMVIPIFERCIRILYKKGLIEDIRVKGKVYSLQLDNSRAVQIKYKSPLLALQDRDDLNNTQQMWQMLVGVFTDQAPLVVEVSDFPRYIAEKLGADLSLLKPKSEVEALFKQVAKNALQQQQAAQSATPPYPQEPLPAPEGAI